MSVRRNVSLRSNLHSYGQDKASNKYLGVLRIKMRKGKVNHYEETSLACCNSPNRCNVVYGVWSYAH